MNVKAIICELNPPHYGHKEIIEKAKEDGSFVIALMSGNFVQRGSCSLFGKYDKAAMAIKMGFDLVLELPYPFSSSYAQSFASSSIHILSSLGIVDELVFGCVNISSKQEIIEIANRLMSVDVELFISNIRQKNPTLSQNQLRTTAYEAIYGQKLKLTPNDILAVEYAQAIIRQKSKIKISPIQRTSTWSASSSRKLLLEYGLSSIDSFLPVEALEIAKNSKLADENVLNNILLHTLISTDPRNTEKYEGCCGGIADKFKNHAMTSNSFSSFVESTTDKTTTRASIKRRSLNILFEVEEEILKSSPRYSLVLGANKNGLKLLKLAGRNFTIITKPSSYQELLADEISKSQINLELISDSTYCILQGNPPNYYLLQKPYLEN